MSVINQSLANKQKRKAPQSVASKVQQNLSKQAPALPYIIMTVCFIAIAGIGIYQPVNVSEFFKSQSELTSEHNIVKQVPTTAPKIETPIAPVVAPQETNIIEITGTPETTNEPEVAKKTESAIEGAIEGTMQVTAAQGKSREIANHMENARLALQRQDIRSAVDFLSQLQSLKPDHMQSRLLLARLYYQNDEVDMALSTLQANANAITYTADYLDLRATLYSEIGNYHSAIKDYERLTLIHPDNIKWLLGSAIAYDKINAYQDAYSVYIKVKQKGELPKNIDNFVGQRLAVLKDLI